MAMPARSFSLDTLRGLAVMFMLEVHLGFWWTRGLPDGDPLVGLATALGGMAAPLFFTIAGAGLSISRRVEPGSFQAKNLRRGAALLAAGLVFTCIEMAVYGPWGWGVLQCLGVSIVICTATMRAGPAARAMAGIAVMAAAPFLRHAAGIPDVLFSDSMMGVSSLQGYLSSAFLSGFFPLVPWSGFMLLGTVAGELSFSGPSTSGAESAPAGARWPLALLASFLILTGAAGAAGGMPMEFFPASLPFCLLASGLCIAALAVAGLFPGKPVWAQRAAPLASMGRLSLTIFVAHHLIGYSAFSAAGLLHSFDTTPALAMVLVSWALAAAAAVLWARQNYRYSLEWLLGHLAGRASK
jgi:uncharacterized membrane protein